MSPSLSSPLEQNVVIVGIGLIGGSLAAALKHRNVAQTIIGVGRDSARLDAARRAGLIDEFTTDISTVAARTDVAVFCTPVERIVKDVLEFSRIVGDRCAGRADRLLLTDVGSVKAEICQQLSHVANFIGSHPIAGSHKHGFEAADANLFNDRMCVLTPVATSRTSQIDRLDRFWKSVGMRTLQLSPDAHDRKLAITSHLPHLIAASLAATLSENDRSLTGSGFRDTTRIAAGEPDLWTDIFVQNAGSVIEGIDRFEEQVARYRSALLARDSMAIHQLLSEGQSSRIALDQSNSGIE